MRTICGRVRTDRLPTPRVRPASRALAAAACTAATLICVPHAAAAAPGAGPQVDVGVRQASGIPAAYFTLHGLPGARARAGSLVLSNPSSRALTVHLGAVNGLTAGTLGSLYATPAQADRGSTSWLSLGAPAVVVPPHGTRSVEVAVAVPRSAAPGDYLSGVNVETVGSSRTTSPSHGLEIGEAYRYVVGVETRLAGARRPHVRFTGALVVREPSTVSFQLLATNDGNVILKNVHGSVRITQGQRQVVSETIPPGTFVSHTSIELPVPARGEHPSAGTVYRVRAELVYQGGIAYLDTLVTFSRRAARVQAQYVPRKHHAGLPGWVVAAIAAGALLLLALAAYRWRRREPLSRSATLARLGREVERGRAQGAPLSLVAIALAESLARSERRRLARVMRRTLRRSDSIGDLEDGRLLVMLPHMSASLAQSLASELTTLVRTEGMGALIRGVHASTPDAQLDVEQILAQAIPRRDDDRAARDRDATVRS